MNKKAYDLFSLNLTFGPDSAMTFVRMKEVVQKWEKLEKAKIQFRFKSIS